MNYISLDTIPHFKECASVVADSGFTLVELQIVPQSGMVRITAVIASKDPSKDIGVADCSKVHHALQPKLIALLGKSEDDIIMEVCSPGLERNIKNAAEFSCFVGREIRVWDKNVSDWIRGKIKSSDSEQVTLETEADGDKAIAYNDIAKAKFIHL
ncbi:MAG: ribosome maturation factor [Treponema sp.]|nr:ribosome maturation factor [Treponema sp.]